MFSQYTNFNDIEKNSNLEKMYIDSTKYFVENGIHDYLIGICFGGGIPEIGELTIGQNGSIQSIYEAITPCGIEYEYFDSNGDKIYVKGTGKIVYGNTCQRYNSIVLDIELGNVQTSDLIDLINYIKYIDRRFVVISVISHTTSYFLPEVSKGMLESDVSDYISLILYTQMFGTTNEYVANSYLSWKELFVNCLSKNKKFTKYGLNYLIPSIYSADKVKINNKVFPGMYTKGGSNDKKYPNNYYYNSSQSQDSPVIIEFGGNDGNLDYHTVDHGAVNFLNRTLQEYYIPTKIPFSSTCGGYISWSNYDNGFN